MGLDGVDVCRDTHLMSVACSMIDDVDGVVTEVLASLCLLALEVFES